MAFVAGLKMDRHKDEVRAVDRVPSHDDVVARFSQVLERLNGIEEWSREVRLHTSVWLEVVEGLIEVNG
jgi:hypothetical protein